MIFKKYDNFKLLFIFVNFYCSYRYWHDIISMYGSTMEVRMRNVGTVVRGIRTPIIKDGDDLANIVVDALMKAKESEKFEFRDRDIVAVTEAVVTMLR